MQTTNKAFSLLSLFSRARAEIGLSEMSRLAKFDKATTRRLLVSLMHNGLIEQNVETRKYRLGAALIRLAHVREETFPVSSIVRPVLKDLVAKTNETAHYSELSNQSLQILEVVSSPQPMRVNLEFADPLPLHCTASGLAVLSYQPSTFVNKHLSRKLSIFTDKTVVDSAKIRKMVDDARNLGYGCIDSGFESGVYGIAAAVFDSTGYANAAVAVATPVARMTDKQFELTKNSVRTAAVEISRGFGAEPSDKFINAN
jgi:IclR family transcriptional regulator, acetate operon repressor